MPFLDPEVRRAYSSGYQSGYRIDVTISVASAKRKAVCPFDNTQPQLAEAWHKGFRKSIANRQGESQRKRRAEWYQANKARVVAKQRKQRRMAAKDRAAQAVKLLEKRTQSS